MEGEVFRGAEDVVRAGGAEGCFGGRVEHGEHAAARGAGGGDADGGVLDGEAIGGWKIESFGGECVGLGVGLGVGDVIAGDDGVEEG